VRILTPKDGGKIQLLQLRDEGARLAIRPDDHAEDFRQFFSFVARDVAGKRCTFEITNAAACTYGDAFEGYRVCASVGADDDWFRVPTELDGGTLRFAYEGPADAVRFAYFAPYARARRLELLARIEKTQRATTTVIGKTVSGEPMHLVSFGSDNEDARKLWIVGQQHPGETMAGWFMEGLASRLAFDDDPLVTFLRERTHVFLVLCMNPDGAFAGNHRTNAAGKDLNRCWWEADEKESPEVFSVRKAMYEHGVDFFFDVHGDEHVPYVFVAGAEGNPHYTDRIEALEDRFSEAMLEASSEFQTEQGYPKDAPGKGDLRCASNYVGEAFDCLSLTLEMPFKDNDNAPDERVGWSVDRSRTLGASTLEAVAAMIDDLRE
jgi:murein tripeptide amidase MpaA